MPSRNSRKTYFSGGIYHVYNRGVNKETIFSAEEDYWYLMNLCRRFKNQELRIFCLNLMPNHYHFELQQEDRISMSKFIHRVFGSYSIWYNGKYGRVGHLFQGRYKARQIESEEDFKNTSRYIHQNPLDLGIGFEALASYRFSTYCGYVGKEKLEFVDYDRILKMFDGSSKYKSFVEAEKEGQAAAWPHFI